MNILVIINNDQKINYIIDNIKNHNIRIVYDIDNIDMNIYDIILCSSEITTFNPLLLNYLDKFILLIFDFKNNELYKLYKDNKIKYYIGCAPESNNGIYYPLYLSYVKDIIDFNNISFDEFKYRKDICIIDNNNSNKIFLTLLKNEFNIDILNNKEDCKYYKFCICLDYNDSLNNKYNTFENLMISCLNNCIPILTNILDENITRVFNTDKFLLFDLNDDSAFNKMCCNLKLLLQDTTFLKTFSNKQSFNKENISILYELYTSNLLSKFNNLIPPNKLYLITFTPTNNYSNIVELCNKIKEYNIFTKLYCYNSYDLTKYEDFYTLNKNYISQYNDTHGNHLWKPYLINQVFNDINDNDIVIYIDYSVNNKIIDSVVINDLIDNMKSNDGIYINNSADILALKKSRNNSLFLNEFYNIFNKVKENVNSIEDFKKLEYIFLNKYNIQNINMPINIINKVNYNKQLFNLCDKKTSNIIINMVTTFEKLKSPEFKILIDKLLNSQVIPKLILIHCNLEETVDPYNIINKDYPSLIILCYKSTVGNNLSYLENIYNNKDKLSNDDKMLFINDDFMNINLDVVLLHELCYQTYNCEGVIGSGINNSFIWDGYDNELNINNTYSIKCKYLLNNQIIDSNSSLDINIKFIIDKYQLYLCGLNINTYGSIKDLEISHDINYNLNNYIEPRYLLKNVDFNNCSYDGFIDIKYLNSSLLLVTIMYENENNFIILNENISISNIKSKKSSYLIECNQTFKITSQQNKKVNFNINNDSLQCNDFYDINNILLTFPNLEYSSKIINECVHDTLLNSIKNSDYKIKLLSALV